MRPSNRDGILHAAVRIAETRGISGVTLDAVADEAGLTKGGLIYHFSTKDALLLGIQEHLAAQWERDLEMAAGKTAAEATDRERLLAYIEVSARSATHAELTMQLESVGSPELNAPWAAVLGRWRPALDPADTSRSARSIQVALLAAEGLWTVEMLGLPPLSEDDRRQLVAHIVASIDS